MKYLLKSSPIWFFLLLDHRSNYFLGILHHLGDTQAHDEKKWVAKIKKHIMTLEEYVTN